MEPTRIPSHEALSSVLPALNRKRHGLPLEGIGPGALQQVLRVGLNILKSLDICPAALFASLSGVAV